MTSEERSLTHSLVQLVLKPLYRPPYRPLYRMQSRWCSPEELERSLAESSKRRGQQLPTHVWKRLQERKAAVKKKMRLLAMQV